MGRVLAGYCDGGVIHSSRSEFGGMWAWAIVEDDCCIMDEDAGVVTPEMMGLPNVTNNHTELIAMLNLVENLPDDFVGTICSDSHVTLQRVFHVTLEAKAGYLKPIKSPYVAMNNVPSWLREKAVDAKRKIAAIRNHNDTCRWKELSETEPFFGIFFGVRPVLLKGHPTKDDLQWGFGKRGREGSVLPVSQWNVYCDETCTRVGEVYMQSIANKEKNE